MLCKSSHENVSPKPSTLYCMEMMKLSISLIQLHKNSHHFSKVITIFSVFLLSFISIIQISFWCIISKSLDRMEAQELASKQKLVFCCQLIAAPLSPTFCSTNLLSEESHNHATSGFCASKAIQPLWIFFPSVTFGWVGDFYINFLDALFIFNTFGNAFCIIIAPANS